MTEHPKVELPDLAAIRTADFIAGGIIRFLSVVAYVLQFLVKVLLVLGHRLWIAAMDPRVKEGLDIVYVQVTAFVLHFVDCIKGASK